VILIARVWQEATPPARSLHAVLNRSTGREDENRRLGLSSRAAQDLDAFGIRHREIDHDDLETPEAPICTARFNPDQLNVRATQRAAFDDIVRLRPTLGVRITEAAATFNV
jgi:hypothetical protein